MPDRKLRVCLFGGLRIEGNGHGPIELSRQQTGALLGCLALHLDKCHNREELIAIFWPDDDTEDGRRKLRQSVYALRRQFETDSTLPLFISTRDTVKLNPEMVSTDVEEFDKAITHAGRCNDPRERLTYLLRAQSLYRGDLLAGFYQDDILSYRSQYAAKFRVLLQKTARIHEALGDLIAAIDTATSLVAQDRTNEEACAELMRLQAAAGRPSEILRQIRELERAILTELDAKPSAAIYALAEQLRAEAELGLPPPAAVIPATEHVQMEKLNRPSRRGRRFSLAALLAMLALPVLGWMTFGRKTPALYTVVDLGTFGGNNGQAGRINNFALVTGRAANPSNDALEACVWSSAGIHHLPDLGKPPNSASDVNDSGQAIGVATDKSSVGHAVLWDGTGVHHMAANISPASINSAGRVTGYHLDRSGTTCAVIWDRTNGLRELGRFGSGFSEARDINNADYIVGTYRSNQGKLRAFMWDRIAGMRDLGTLGGDTADASGINDSGRVVGSAQTPGNGPVHAFLWDCDNGMRDIGPPGATSEAHKINRYGQVVGSYKTDSGSRAFLWSPTTGVVDLNTILDRSGAGWVLDSASDISDNGWIVGTGTYQSHSPRPFLLKPSDTSRVSLQPGRMPLTAPAAPRIAQSRMSGLR